MAGPRLSPRRPPCAERLYKPVTLSYTGPAGPAGRPFERSKFVVHLNTVSTPEDALAAFASLWRRRCSTEFRSYGDASLMMICALRLTGSLSPRLRSMALGSW